MENVQKGKHFCRQKLPVSIKNLNNGKCPKWQTVLQAKSSWINESLNKGKCLKWQKFLRGIKA